MTKKFRQGDILEATYEDNRLKLVSDVIYEQRRWMTSHEFIFQELNTGEYYQHCVDFPSTESSGDYPDYEEIVECDRMVPVEVIVTQYKPYE